MAEHFIPRGEAETNLLACASYLAENINSADGRAEAMKIIVPHYIEKSEVDLAAELSDTVEDPFVRDRLLTLVAEKCAAEGDDDYAFQLVEAIEDYGTQEAARERIALQKSSRGEFEKAFEIADSLAHPDYAFAGLAIHLHEKSREAEAFETLGRIEFPNAKVSALQNIALRELENGNKDKTIELLDEAVSTAGEIEHTEEKIRAFIEIANSFTEANRSDSAVEALGKAKATAETLDNVHYDFLLASVALGFLRAGSIDLADRTLDLVEDKTQIASCLLGFAQEFWKKDERDEALETLEEAYAILKSQRDRETRDSRARYALFASIAVQFAGFEKAERAIEIAQENDDSAQQNLALTQIAQICIMQKKDDLARQALQAINEDYSRMFALIAMADAKNKIEERDEAVKLLSEAAELSETVPQLSMRSAALNEFVKWFNLYGETDKAREIATENLQIIAQIRDESSRTAAMTALADVFEKYNYELSEAEKSVLQTLIRKADW